MAFIKIFKNGKTLEVSKSSFENFFRNSGWSEVNKNLTSSNHQKSSRKPENKNINNTKDSELNVKEEASGESSDDEWAEVLEEEIQKPITEMNRDELIEFAKANNISLEGLTKNNQFREAIREALKNREV